jgi:hypothetical protein
MPTYRVLRPLKIDNTFYGPTPAYSSQVSSGDRIEMSAAEAGPLIESGTLTEENTMTSRRKMEREARIANAQLMAQPKKKPKRLGPKSKPKPKAAPTQPIGLTHSHVKR